MITTNYKEQPKNHDSALVRLVRFILPDIEKGRYTRFFSTCFTTLFIVLAYSISRKAKDTCISLAVPVEVISFVKLALVMPLTVISVIVYNLVSHKINRDNFAYWLSIPFILYFGTFGLISIIDPSIFQRISPNIDLVPYSPMKCLNVFFHEISLVINYFPVTVLYAISEIYAVWDVNYIFWYLVNSYTKISDAKILYPYYLLSSSIGLVISGIIGFIVNKVLMMIPGTKFRYDTYYNGVCLLLCCMSIIISRITYTVSLREHLKYYVFTQEDRKLEDNKKSMTLREKWEFLSKENIIGLSIVCVLMYMSSVVQLDSIAKKVNYKYFITVMQDRGGFDNFLNKSQVITGVTTVICSYLFRLVVRHCCWFIIACITPLSMLVATIILFITTVLSKYAIGSIISPLKIAVYTGLLVGVISKTCKYAFFDYAINMSMLYLNREARNAGKSVTDSFGGKFGKAMGSGAQQLLYSALVPVSMMSMGQEIIAPYLFCIILISCAIWILSIISINKEINRISTSRNNL